jgi:hypothetical protein
LFSRQMRWEDCEKEKTGRKQRNPVKLSVPSRGSDAHSACNVHLSLNEAGKARCSRFSAGLDNFGNYFSRVGDCENKGGINCRTDDRRRDPTVRPWKRTQGTNFFSRVDSCENQFTWQELRQTHRHLVCRALGLWPENAFLNHWRLLVSDAKIDGSLARC